MIETFNQCFSLKFNPDKSEKYKGWAVMIGIISCKGAYSITGQIFPWLF